MILVWSHEALKLASSVSILCGLFSETDLLWGQGRHLQVVAADLSVLLIDRNTIHQYRARCKLLNPVIYYIVVLDNVNKIIWPAFNINLYISKNIIEICSQFVTNFDYVLLREIQTSKKIKFILLHNFNFFYGAISIITWSVLSKSWSFDKKRFINFIKY